MGCCGGFVGQVFGAVGDAISDVGSFIDDNVIQPVLNDPIGTAAKIAAVATGNPELLPIISGVDTAAHGGDIGDIALSAGKSYLGNEISSNLDFGSPDVGNVGDASTVGDVVSSYGDQAGDFPIDGSYGNPLASGVQDAAQNLLDNNALQQISGVIPPTLGDQAGDYPLEGNYGNPLAEGVQQATQNLLDYNANYANPSLLSSLTDIAKGFSGGQQAGGGSTAYLLAKGLTGGQQSMPIGYNMNQHPFSYPTAQPIQGNNTTSTVPQELQQQNTMSALASLLRK